MAVISNAGLTIVLDKLARFANEAVGDTDFNPAFSAGMETASNNVFTGAGALDTYLLTLADIDVIADLLPAARDLDESHPTPPTGFLLRIAGVQAMITALNNHIKAYGSAASLDAYLTALNATTPTLRAHQSFRTHFATLSAKNVFIPADVDIARINVSGATAGTYTHLATISSSTSAGAKLVAKNVGALTATTALSMTGVKLDGTTATLTVTISTLTDTYETNLSDTTKKFINVTAITVVSGGTSGNVIKIVAKTDRDISAA